MNDKKLKVEITELFMAQADKYRKFYGTIKRSAGMVYGTIEINDGQIHASAKDQWELGKKLDNMVKLILDANLHEIKPIINGVGISTHFLN